MNFIICDVCCVRAGEYILRPLNSVKFMMPGIAEQLRHLLNRSDIQDEFWAHQTRASPVGYLADFFDGNVWKFWLKQLIPEGAGATWFGRHGMYECAFGMNMYDASAAIERVAWVIRVQSSCSLSLCM